MICSHCGHSDEREYPNLYGTYCKGCGKFVKSESEPEFVTENRLKLKLLQATARQIMREHMDPDKKDGS